jgi:hypothetical protein
MRISKDTNPDGLINDISTLIRSLNSISTTYSNSITTLKSKTNKINFNNVWSDPVQMAVENHVNALKQDTTDISNDITSGNFNKLKSKLNSILTEANNFKTSKNDLKTRQEKLASLDPEDENYESNKSILEDAIASAKRMIENQVSRINTLLGDIEKIEFNKKFEETELPVQMIEPDDIDTIHESEKPKNKATSYMEEVQQNKAGWIREPAFTTKDDKTQLYSYTTSDGTEVNMTTTKEGEVLIYTIIDEDGNVHFYDSQFEEISLTQRNKIKDDYNSKK